MAVFLVACENEQNCHLRFRAGDGIMRYDGYGLKGNIAQNEVTRLAA